MSSVRALVAVAAALVLTACGGAAPSTKASSAAAPSAASGSSGGAATFPVTVTHKYGSTRVTAAPRRVVTLGLSDQDAVLALGVVPVGAVDWFEEKPFGSWPWVKDRWGTTPPAVVGQRDEYNVERIASLRPDLIIAQYSGMTREQYTMLSKIAPVVAQPTGHDDYAAPWQVMTKVIGTALGKRSEADALVADVEATFDQARSANPGFSGKTVAVAESYEPGKYAVFTPTDPKVVFMTRLGFVVPDAIAKAAGSEYAAEISSERLDLVDVDRAVFLTNSADEQTRINTDAVFATLAVATEGRTTFLPYQDPPLGAALSFSTVLSLPYALEQIIPKLAAR
jgi:iron complex transport system substrate-binding protein